MIIANFLFLLVPRGLEFNKALPGIIIAIFYLYLLPGALYNKTFPGPTIPNSFYFLDFVAMNVNTFRAGLRMILHVTL